MHDAGEALRRHIVSMTVIRRWIDDTEVGLAFYGSIVYVAVVAALGAQRSPPPPTEAISAVVASGSVLYVAHVFAGLVPKAARAGRLKMGDLLSSLRHDAALLISGLLPVFPLLLATWGVLTVERGYTLSVRATIALLFALAVALSRRDGLPWKRAIVAGLVIIAVTAGVIWLESRVH